MSVLCVSICEFGSQVVKVDVCMIMYMCDYMCKYICKYTCKYGSKLVLMGIKSFLLAGTFQSN